MKIDVTQVLKARNGEPLEQAVKVENGKVIEKEEITLKIAAVGALDAMTKKDEGISGAEKRKRGALADKIYEADGELDLSIDEVKLLKDRVGDVSSTYIVNEVYKILGE